MPKLRNAFATQGEANALARAVQEWLHNTDPTALFQTCLTCHQCDRDTAVCKKFKRVPPVAVITGQLVCRDYDDAEDIPF